MKREIVDGSKFYGKSYSGELRLSTLLWKHTAVTQFSGRLNYGKLGYDILSINSEFYLKVFSNYRGRYCKYL